MPTNVHPEYSEAEKLFYAANTDDERVEALEEMIRWMPKHKGAENLRSQIRTRHKKLKQKLQKEKVKARARGKGAISIRKGEMQAALIGLTNSGKSSLLKRLTNADPKIASYGFTTTKPEQAILNYQGIQIQIIDMPPIGSESFDKSIAHTADTALLVVEKISEIKELQEVLKKSKAKQIIVFNKIDLHDSNTRRKIQATLKSKRYKFQIISCDTKEGIPELEEKIFKSFNKIRVYTKEPGKPHDDEPMILEPKSTIEEAAKKTLHGKAKDIIKMKIWGPSSKFGGQEIGKKHVLKDKDVVEFATK